MAEIVKEIPSPTRTTVSPTPAATMLADLLMSSEEREETGEHEIPEAEMGAGLEEIAELFEELLEEDVPEDAEKYINMILGHMASGSTTATREYPGNGRLNGPRSVATGAHCRILDRVF